MTFGQRGKEEAADYRYFPDPDLVPVTISEERKRKIHEAFCEFPAAKRDAVRDRASALTLRRVGDRRTGGQIRGAIRADSRLQPATGNLLPIG